MRIAHTLIAMAFLGASSGISNAQVAPLKGGSNSSIPFSWTGYYLGGNIGHGSFNSESSYDFNNHYYDIRDNGGEYSSSSLKASDKVLLGGSQAGFNLQSGITVVGLETDIAFVNARTRTAKEYCESCTDGDQWYYKLAQETNSSLRALGTLRGRVGLAFDRMFIYATGGLAYGKVHDTYNIAGNDDSGDPDGVFSVSKTSWRLGWTAGGGVEYAFTQAISLKLEGLYYDLGTTHLGTSEFNSFQFTNFSSFSQTIKHDGVLARTGMNFKF